MELVQSLESYRSTVSEQKPGNELEGFPIKLRSAASSKTNVASKNVYSMHYRSSPDRVWHLLMDPVFQLPNKVCLLAQLFTIMLLKNQCDRVIK